MNKIYFGNDYSSGTPIPKAMWWYIQEMEYKFEKYPEELTKFYPITKEDIELYKKELRINE